MTANILKFKCQSLANSAHSYNLMPSDTRIALLRYTTEHVVEVDESDPSVWDSKDALLWIDISGLRDHDRISAICDRLGVHPLVIADLLDTDQRPKTEVSGKCLHIVLKMPVGGPPFEADQLTLILGDGFVISIREHQRDCFDPVRKRLNDGGTRIRGSSGQFGTKSLQFKRLDESRCRSLRHGVELG
ncbi:CorA family divalent cation transporter [Hoeflea alexandrii]|uniref:Magnesium transporter CorA n=1 Tax=Hoeflea alexandrii TaxID=288436 RepID=A0ABT1CZT5_9HYPH|nr:CorA family divalent cation transporter [Hoeflea alexandrii]MCO6411076.1 hypothetical protein [Hoeflea alexandrii]MCY0150934.1 hypothetical protein [Hoeflea alexandrii]